MSEKPKKPLAERQGRTPARIRFDEAIDPHVRARRVVLVSNILLKCRNAKVEELLRGRLEGYAQGADFEFWFPPPKRTYHGNSSTHEGVVYLVFKNQQDGRILASAAIDRLKGMVIGDRPLGVKLCTRLQRHRTAKSTLNYAAGMSTGLSAAAAGSLAPASPAVPNPPVPHTASTSTFSGQPLVTAGAMTTAPPSFATPATKPSASTGFSVPVNPFSALTAARAGSELSATAAKPSSPQQPEDDPDYFDIYADKRDNEKSATPDEAAISADHDVAEMLEDLDQGQRDTFADDAPESDDD